MPRLTLSVTTQKSSKSRSHRSSRGRSLSLTSGDSSTSMPLIRKRPCSLRATCATTGGRQIDRLESGFAQAESKARGQAVADGGRQHRGSIRARCLRQAAAARRRQSAAVAPSRETSPRTRNRARTEGRLCSFVFQTSLSPCLVGFARFFVAVQCPWLARSTVERRLERAFDHAKRHVTVERRCSQSNCDRDPNSDRACRRSIR